jgi:LacI family transcriptional regulator
MSKPQKQVALIIETYNEHARRLLRGIRAFTGKNETWVIHFRGLGNDQDDLSWLQNWQGDGLIARITSEAIASYVSNAKLPALDLTSERLVPELSYLEANNHAVANLAASHLLERGFKQFGFLGDSAFFWSRLREQHFCQAIEAQGFSCRPLDLRDERQKFIPLGELQSKIAHWLEKIPKPVGIMASSDVLGRLLLETCRLADIKVPDEVAVIGVDNDTLLCELADPPLSSVVLDAFRTGFLAASLLQQLMDGKKLGSKAFHIEPLGIVTRPSTEFYVTDDEQILGALSFIRTHACNDIKVEDVLTVVPLSRRALEARFHKVTGRTPHEEISRLKLQRVKELLLEPSLSLQTIAELTGFKHPEYLSVFFKRETGLSPSDYRTTYPSLLR